MKAFVTIVVILAIGAGVVWFFVNQKTRKQNEAERKIYGGKTKQEFVSYLKSAWHGKFIEANNNHIMTEKTGMQWKNDIIAQMETSGDVRPLSEVINIHSEMAYGMDKPRANDTGWGQRWLAGFIKNELNLDNKIKEINDIMLTI